MNKLFCKEVFDFSTLSDEELAMLIKYNFIARNKVGQYFWLIPVISNKQSEKLEDLLSEIATEFVPIIADIAEKVYLIYQSFVPQRLHSQIRGVMGGEIHRIIGLIIEKFISDGYLKEPNEEYFTQQVIMIYS